MKRILRRQRSGYALAVILCLIGLTFILITLWKTWPEISLSQDPISTFWTNLWTQSVDSILGIAFKLGYLAIFGAVAMTGGVTVWLLSRQWLFVPEEKMLFQCPFCKKRWMTIRDKGLVLCPHCRQLIHPTMVER